MLKQGIIQHSTSPYNSLIWVVPKKVDSSGEQKWRLVNDYRPLNEQTVDDKHPIPNVQEEENTSNVATIHSGIEERLDFISIKEGIVNIYRTQILIVEQKVKEFELLNGKRKIYIDKNDIENDYFVTDILRRHLPEKGTVGIHSELSDHEYNIVQLQIVELYSNNRNLKFIKCTSKAIDLINEEQCYGKIKEIHEKGNHRGIQENFEEIKHLYYYKKIIQLITKYINNCEESIEIHFTSPKSHTGNSDISRAHSSLLEHIRTLTLTERDMSISEKVLKATEFYNTTIHTTINCKPLDVQLGQVDKSKIAQLMQEKKEKWVSYCNKNREQQQNITHDKVYIKNYVNERYKEEPKYRKARGQKTKIFHKGNLILFLLGIITVLLQIKSTLAQPSLQVEEVHSATGLLLIKKSNEKLIRNYKRIYHKIDLRQYELTLLELEKNIAGFVKFFEPPPEILFSLPTLKILSETGQKPFNLKSIFPLPLGESEMYNIPNSEQIRNILQQVNANVAENSSNGNLPDATCAVLHLLIRERSEILLDSKRASRCEH
ncbi:unnamed protein product [Hermetia illucens]|uniref:Integrase zinc-binding domain-containing protein n=1 Tax=Hermetia illucens TaxID=343691 RepID=A0A7R8UCQ5_HERIL|nr:unnamed protein product [Hermetia illucens]